MRIGDLSIDPVIDGELRVNATQWYPAIAADAIAAHPRWFGADGSFSLALGGFLVRGGARTIVIDAGLGPYLPAEDNGGRFLEELRALGTAPEDVTDVVFTHLHYDHVGWATQKGAVVFPNATYRCDAADWAHFVPGDEAATRKLRPVEDRLETWTGSVTLAPGLNTMPTPGHTPGHTAFVLSGGTERLYLLGDAAHCPVELEDDEWDGISDVDPVAARRMRAALAARFEASGERFTGAHFPGMAYGRLLRLDGVRAWTPSEGGEPARAAE